MRIRGNDPVGFVPKIGGTFPCSWVVARGLVCWRSAFFVIIGMGLHRGIIRGSTGTADIDCIVGECARGGLLFGSRVCYQWLECPEKSELWHNVVST